MKLKEVVFLKSVAINAEKIFLDSKKEIIFIGRSNVCGHRLSFPDNGCVHARGSPRRGATLCWTNPFVDCKLITTVPASP